MIVVVVVVVTSAQRHGSNYSSYHLILLRRPQLDRPVESDRGHHTLIRGEISRHDLARVSPERRQARVVGLMWYYGGLEDIDGPIKGRGQQQRPRARVAHVSDGLGVRGVDVFACSLPQIPDANGVVDTRRGRLVSIWVETRRGDL